MGAGDRRIIERLIESTEGRKGCDRLLQKDIANYMGVPETTLSYWLKLDVDCLPLEALLKLTDALHKPHDSKFEAKILKDLQDTALDIATEKLTDGMRSVCKHRIMTRMKKNDAIRFLDGPTSIIFVPSDTMAVADYLSEIVKQETVPSFVNVIISPQWLPEVIENIEQWAYSAKGDFSRYLVLNVFTTNVVISTGRLAGYIDGKFVGFIESDEGDFIQMPDALSTVLTEREQRLTNEECVWHLLRTPEARQIRRFLRTSVAEKLSRDVTQFLEGKIANFEVHGSIDDPLSGNVLKDYKKEIERILGSESANHFSRLLSVYWLSLDAGTLETS